MAHERTTTITVWAVALAMIAAPATALASHNSYGGVVHVVQADEFDPATGEIVPDVPSKESPGDRQSDHPYVVNHHKNVDPPREAPPDQTGEAYTGTCTPYGQVSDEQYFNNLGADGSSCYVGYFDAQVEYLILTTLLFTEQSSDPLYPYNPKKKDEYCTGKERPRDHAGPALGILVVDKAIANATRADDPECQGSGHSTFWPGFDTLAIDTDLLEAPFQGLEHPSDTIGANDLAGSPKASGTLTMPFMLTPYVYLFGQPHPDVSVKEAGYEDASERPKAGVGVFGPTPPGSPLTDLSGACGDRTKACTLLSPADIKAYDSRNPAPGSVSQARVCEFLPQYFSLTPGALQVSPCGPFGSAVSSFYPTISEGGFGTGADTWFTPLPGWHEEAILVNHQSTTLVADFNCDGGSLCHDYLEDGDQMGPGNLIYHAVNPKVPTPSHPLWCVKPNFIGTATDKQFTLEDGSEVTLSDNGFYDYNADAIDSDVYTHFVQTPARTVRDLTHDHVRSVARPIQDVAPDRSEIISRNTVDDAGSQVDDEAAEQRVDERSEIPQEIKDLYDRADYLEAQNSDAQAEYHPDDYKDDGTPKSDATNQRPFKRSFDSGLGCTPSGFVKLRETSQTVTGGLRFDARISQQTVAIKDPTIRQDGLPADEDDTRRDTWMVDSYSFGGPFQAVLESNGDEEFDPCTEAQGQPQPSHDFCPWFALWDAHNPQCTGVDGQACSRVLEQLGYAPNSSSGVGMYFVLKVSGPTLVYDEDTNQNTLLNRTELLGDRDDTTAQNCVVGVATGYLPYLYNHTGQTDPAQRNKTKLLDDLCGSLAGGGGERLLIADAFDDQGGLGGGFSAAVEFVKLLPTPDAAAQGGSTPSSDELCVHAVFNTQSDTSPTEDTSDNIDLTGLEEFEDCDALST